MSWLRSLENVVFPPYCAACDAPLLATQVAFCGTCAVSVEPLQAACTRCATPFAGPSDGVCRRCRKKPLAFQRLYCALIYGGSVQVALTRFKYRNRQDIVRALNPLWQQTFENATASCEVVVPIPLHWWRAFRRGYNQAELIWHAARCTMPLDVRSLVRVSATVPQMQLQAPARRRNVRDAFRVARNRRAAIAGKSVLVIDDIATTCATLDAAARALLRAGARSVDAFCLARAEE